MGNPIRTTISVLGRNDMKKRRVRVGEIYQDCTYHPVLCTESSADDVLGISLIDGTYPRSCSPMHCGIRRLTLKQALRIKMKGPGKAVEAKFRELEKQGWCCAKSAKWKWW